ncbi:MAG TPA: chalcone isomerase family protein [Kiritimatiellia bacterium]|nr:chalcone isomerase family protein [Kiritimatiellia bacterium]
MKLYKTSLTCLLAASTLLLAAQSSSARRIDHLFPTEKTVHGLRLERIGVSHLRVGFVFPVYDAALFAEPGRSARDIVLGDVGKSLHIQYLRSISRDQLIRAADDMMANFLSPAQIAQIQPGIDAINALYKDVGKGDAYTLTYIPGFGTELSLNGKLLGRIEGAEFAIAYFRIWLDESIPYTDFRNRLLQGAN